MDFMQEITAFADKLGGSGVFLTSGGKPNTMTANWGFTGVMWGKPILVMPVRPTRYTYGLIKECGEFSVTVPSDIKLNKQLGYFGSVSGKDRDKYKEQGITPVKCKSINTFVIPGNCFQIECRLIYENNILESMLDSAAKKRWYEDKSYHTMFYGEIINAYKTV